MKTTIKLALSLTVLGFSGSLFANTQDNAQVIKTALTNYTHHSFDGAKSVEQFNDVVNASKKMPLK